MKRESKFFPVILGVFFFLASCGNGEEKTAEVEKPTKVFAPTVAGTFYPAEKEELRGQITGFLTSSPRLGLRGLRAVIVPHAGYQYSGAVAAHAFREVSDGCKTVFILADNHNREAEYTGVSFPEAGAMAVPGGEIPLSEICRQLEKAAPDLFCRDPHAHDSHVVEVELPFLLAAHRWPEKPEFEVVPLVFGGALTDEQLDKLADLLEAHVNPEALFVVSTDLSHFQSDQTARKIDIVTISRMLAKEGERLQPGSCCGLQAVRTILKLARRRGWETNLLSYDNSASASGDTQRVVGYTAVALTEPLAFTEEEEKALTGFARKVVESKVRDGKDFGAEKAWLDKFPIFRLNRAAFVTIEKEGELRGCIGGLTQLAPIHESVRRFALSAALQDRRFTPVTEEELDSLTYTVSLLTFPSRVHVPPSEFAGILKPHRHGVILEINGRQSTFLPSVWEQIPEPTAFLSDLSRKQGAAPDAWKSPGAVLHLYNALVLHE